MNIKSVFSPFAIAALLAFSPLHDAEARGGKTGNSARSKAATASYGGRPVVRDHRANPRPWSLPAHWHHHGNRRR